MVGARRAVHGLLFVTLGLTACAGTPPSSAPSASPAPPSSEGRTLIVLVGAEPASIAARPLVSAGTSLRFQQRVVNALPAVIDAKGVAQPELLTTLPTLNTSSWQVFPDGTMQTTYTLRPKLTWHDGQPLTSEDFAFSWHLYSHPDLGAANQQPLTFMSDVTAVDREHFTIKWKRPYPDADNLAGTTREFPAMPHHILGPALDRMATGGKESFVSNPYWTQEFVGLGPYRILNWQSGSYIEFARFENYALGPPKIGKLEMRFGQDANVTVASLLSGAVHLVASLDSTEALRQEWSQTHAGRILDSIASLNFVSFQMRPEYVSPTATLDVRIRRAMAHMVDKPTLVETVYAGQAIPTDTPIWTGSAWGPAVDSSIPTYPFDLRAAESLMNQAGFTRGQDGFYRNSEGRLPPIEVITITVPDKIQSAEVVAEWFKTAGVDSTRKTIPAAQTQDNEVRSVYPGVLVNASGAGESALINLLATTSISSASNRWVGSNRGGWSNPEYDRLLTMFSTTLDRNERMELVRSMLKIYSEEMPLISTFFSTGKDAMLNELKGPVATAPEANMPWNIQEWYFE